MTTHEICRLGFRSAVSEMRGSGSSGRRVAAEITGEVAIGRNHHYSVHVSDTRLGSSGHARFLSYEVEGCCRWDARMRALDLHARNFDAWRAP